MAIFGNSFLVKKVQQVVGIMTSLFEPVPHLHLYQSFQCLNCLSFKAKFKYVVRYLNGVIGWKYFVFLKLGFYSLSGIYNSAENLA